MKDYLTCALCGLNISWELLQHNFEAVKTFHDDYCEKPKPMSINYSELIDGENK